MRLQYPFLLAILLLAAHVMPAQHQPLAPSYVDHTLQTVAYSAATHGALLAVGGLRWEPCRGFPLLWLGSTQGGPLRSIDAFIYPPDLYPEAGGLFDLHFRHPNSLVALTSEGQHSDVGSQLAGLVFARFDTNGLVQVWRNYPGYPETESYPIYGNGPGARLFPLANDFFAFLSAEGVTVVDSMGEPRSAAYPHPLPPTGLPQLEGLTDSTLAVLTHDTLFILWAHAHLDTLARLHLPSNNNQWRPTAHQADTLWWYNAGVLWRWATAAGAPPEALPLPFSLPPNQFTLQLTPSPQGMLLIHGPRVWRWQNDAWELLWQWQPDDIDNVLVERWMALPDTSANLLLLGRLDSPNPTSFTPTQLAVAHRITSNQLLGPLPTYDLALEAWRYRFLSEPVIRAVDWSDNDTLYQVNQDVELEFDLANLGQATIHHLLIASDRVFPFLFCYDLRLTQGYTQTIAPGQSLSVRDTIDWFFRTSRPDIASFQFDLRFCAYAPNHQLETSFDNNCAAGTLVNTAPPPRAPAALRIWPNPSANGWWVDSPTPWAVLELWDPLGRRLMHWLPPATPGPMHLAPAASLPPGGYWLRAISPAGVQSTHWVIKN